MLDNEEVFRNLPPPRASPTHQEVWASVEEERADFIEPCSELLSELSGERNDIESWTEFYTHPLGAEFAARSDLVEDAVLRILDSRPELIRERRFNALTASVVKSARARLKCDRRRTEVRDSIEAKRRRLKDLRASGDSSRSAAAGDTEQYPLVANELDPKLSPDGNTIWEEVPVGWREAVSDHAYGLAGWYIGAIAANDSHHYRYCCDFPSRFGFGVQLPPLTTGDEYFADVRADMAPQEGFRNYPTADIICLWKSVLVAEPVLLHPYDERCFMPDSDPVPEWNPALPIWQKAVVRAQVLIQYLSWRGNYVGPLHDDKFVGNTNRAVPECTAVHMDRGNWAALTNRRFGRDPTDAGACSALEHTTFHYRHHYYGHLFSNDGRPLSMIQWAMILVAAEKGGPVYCPRSGRTLRGFLEMLVVIDGVQERVTRELYDDLFLPFILVAIRFAEACQSQWEDTNRTCVALPGAVRQGVRYMFVRLNRKDYMSFCHSGKLTVGDATSRRRITLSPFSVFHQNGRDVVDCDADAEFELCFDATHHDFPLLYGDSLGRLCVCVGLKFELLVRTWWFLRGCWKSTFRARGTRCLLVVLTCSASREFMLTAGIAC